MAIDLRQFHQTFFDESLEGLASMEAELLRLEHALQVPGFVLDPEQPNRIFRVVHSIKGGGATFGFSTVADFVHVLESLLDDVRAGRRPLDLAVSGLLLRAVDGVRELLDAARSERTPNAALVATLRRELEGALVAPMGPVTKSAPLPGVASANGWVIDFVPRAEFFASGNDPLRILRELQALGPVRVTVDTARLPMWTAFDPQRCYLGWHIELNAAVEATAIGEVFAWVTDDCDLTITPASAPSAAAVPRAGGQDDNAQGSIRVATPKVDALVDMVGELVITQTMLNLMADELTPETLPRLRSGLAQLERHTRELQDCVLGIRMLPIGFVFSRLPRMVRDVAQQLGKRVELKVSGERTELDKTIIERISDPLVHLVRNSIDHGIETPDARVAAGKPAAGEIRLEAYHKGGNVVIEIEDDGRGLDRERILATARARGLIGADVQLEPGQIDELIFVPGFSTAATVNDVSGRGVGLDVVRNNIRGLAGGVEVMSMPGKGTRFTIRLPLTLAIVDGMSVQVGDQVYILPLTWISQCVRLNDEDASRPAGGAEVVALRDEYFPLMRLHEVFGVTPRFSALRDGILVVVEADGKKAALFVDDLRGQQQVVIKSLESHCYKLDGISAATILGDGTVALILDIAALVRRAHGATPTATMPQRQLAQASI